MLHYVFTVDGDWKEYFDADLPDAERCPRVEALSSLIETEMDVLGTSLEGKYIHLVHVSDRAREFFLAEPFIMYWKRIVEGGGDIGVHCHEDDPYKAHFVHDAARMREPISKAVRLLRDQGVAVRAYRGGYLAFTEDIIRILEENEVWFDLSCEPERYFVFEDKIISDWRGAPYSLYRMSYSDCRREGDSKVVEIPMGIREGNNLYLEHRNLDALKRIAQKLQERAEKDSRPVVVTVLSHTYDFAAPDVIEDIQEKIEMLKEFGSFMNLSAALDIVKAGGI